MRGMFFVGMMLFCLFIFSCASGEKFTKGDLCVTGAYSGWKSHLRSKEILYGDFNARVDPSYLKQYMGERSVRLPEVYFETEDGIFYLPNLTVDYVQSKWRKGLWDSVPGCSEYYAESESVELKNAHAMICNGHLVVFGGPSHLVAIWDKAKAHRYPLPLSYNNLVSLFGEPDSIQEWYGK